MSTIETLLSSPEELRAALDKGAITSENLTLALLDKGKKANEQTNCVITWTPELALKQAKAADERLKNKSSLGFLDGFPILHKDLFCQQGVKTTSGSKTLANWIAPYNSQVVEKLAEAGMVSLGKTNMDEFAMGSSNQTSYFGPVLNPWDLDRTPGGSSGGAAVAASLDLATVTSATDTGGSIRQPAAHCGVIGLKPTYGRISRWGMIAMSSSMDQAGFMAKSTRMIAECLKYTAGKDPRDSTSVDVPLDDYPANLNNSLAGKTFGIPKEYIAALTDSKLVEIFEQAKAVYEQLGVKFVEVSLDHTELALATYYILMTAESSSNLSRYDGMRYGNRAENKGLEESYNASRIDGFGDEVKRRIAAGTFVLSSGYYDAYYVKAQRARRMIANDFLRVFEQCDMLFTPTTPSTAFRLDEKQRDPIEMYREDMLTNSTNLAGLPGISFPTGKHLNLPVGGQLIGPAFSESLMLNACHQYLQATKLDLTPPLASLIN